MIDDLLLGAIRDFVIQSSHHDKCDGYISESPANLNMKKVVEVCATGIDRGLFVRKKSNTDFSAVGIKDRYLFTFDFDVQDATPDVFRVDRGVIAA